MRRDWVEWLMPNALAAKRKSRSWSTAMACRSRSIIAKPSLDAWCALIYRGIASGTMLQGDQQLNETSENHYRSFDLDRVMQVATEVSAAK